MQSIQQKDVLQLFTGMLQYDDSLRMTAWKRVQRHGFTNATDAADYLVNHGVPFRDAHGIVGQLVLLCLDKKIRVG